MVKPISKEDKKKRRKREEKASLHTWAIRFWVIRFCFPGIY